MNDDRRELALPDRRKNTYEQLEERLDTHIGEIEKQFSRWFVRGLIAFAIIGIACAVSLVGFGIVLNEVSDTADQVQAQTAANKATAAQIQQQRQDSIKTECERTNKRHDGAESALVQGSNQDQANAKDAAARKEIRRRRDVTLALLDALAPHQDCEALVAEAVKVPPKKGKPKP